MSSPVDAWRTRTASGVTAAGSQPVGEAEIDQNARRVGRELDARADLLRPFGLVEDQHAKAALRQCQRRGEAADSAAADDDGARRRLTGDPI